MALIRGKTILALLLATLALSAAAACVPSPRSTDIGAASLKDGYTSTPSSLDTETSPRPPVPARASIIEEGRRIALEISRYHGESLDGVVFSEPETVTCPQMDDGLRTYTMKASDVAGAELPELRIAYDGKTWSDVGGRCGECHRPGGDYFGGPGQESGF